MIGAMEGVWTFTIKRRSDVGRPRMLTASVDVKLVSNERHGENGIYLKHGDKEYRDNGSEIVLQAGNTTIQCVVKDDNSGQNIYFFVGKKNISKTGTICTGPDNGFSHCLEFELTVAPEHDKEVIKCLVDKEMEDGEKMIEIFGNLTVHFPPQIESGDKNVVIVQDQDIMRGSDTEIKVEFFSNPEPTEVEWLVNSKDDEDIVRIKAGQRDNEYIAEEVVKIKNTSFANGYQATLKIKHTKHDNNKKKLELKVVNEI